MKIRQGFVSNSSSSSFTFICIANALDNFIETLSPAEKIVFSFLKPKSGTLGNLNLKIIELIQGSYGTFEENRDETANTFLSKLAKLKQTELSASEQELVSSPDIDIAWETFDEYLRELTDKLIRIKDSSNKKAVIVVQSEF